MTPLPHRAMPVEMVTERLRLRMRDARDIDVTMQLHAERLDDPAPRRPWVVWERAEVAARLAAQSATWPGQRFGLYALDLLDTGDTIGYCGLVTGHASDDEPEIAYELLASTWERGYATEAARAVVDAAFGTGRRRLWASVRPWNAPSFAVLARVGFVHDRIEPDEWGDLVLLRCDAASVVGSA